MAEKTNKWLMGCGIGCGALILVGIIIGAVGYLLVRDTVTEFKGVEESREYLEARFGGVQDFTPDPSGRIEPGRIEAFLAVREGMVEVQGKMENTLEQITDDVEEIDHGEGKFWRILGVVRKGMGAIPQFAEFYRVRNEALVDHDIGLGEYYYLYGVAYYAWLEKSPEDGPEFQMMGDSDREGFRWNFDDDEEKEEVKERVYEDRRYRMVRKVRRIVLPMMRRQLEAIEEGPTGVSDTWRRALEREIEEMREDRDRLPWADGLPRVIRESLEPYRYALESSYNGLLNPLELGMDED